MDHGMTRASLKTLLLLMAVVLLTDPVSWFQKLTNNTEALLGLTFNTLRFKTLSCSSGAFLFSSLSELGRFRFSSQSNWRIELVRNFNWNLQLYENHDTRPPVTAPKNDLGITTSLGRSF